MNAVILYKLTWKELQEVLSEKQMCIDTLMVNFMCHSGLPMVASCLVSCILCTEGIF